MTSSLWRPWFWLAFEWNHEACWYHTSMDFEYSSEECHPGTVTNTVARIRARILLFTYGYCSVRYCRIPAIYAPVVVIGAAVLLKTDEAMLRLRIQKNNRLGWSNATGRRSSRRPDVAGLAGGSADRCCALRSGRPTRTLPPRGPSSSWHTLGRARTPSRWSSRWDSWTA